MSGRTVKDEQFDAVVSEMFGPDPGDFDQLPDEDDEAFGRRGGGGRGGRGGGRGGRGRGVRRFARHRWGGGRWHHRGPWFYPYWWWGYPTSYQVYPPADVDPEDLSEKVVDSMFSRRRNE